jgi:hypothetical protein
VVAFFHDEVDSIDSGRAIVGFCLDDRVQTCTSNASHLPFRTTAKYHLPSAVKSRYQCNPNSNIEKGSTSKVNAGVVNKVASVSVAIAFWIHRNRIESV